jgi:cytochrome c oxidase assembly factor CtaG
VAKDAVEALVTALQGIANFLIWFVIFILPVLLIIGVPIWLVIRFFVRRRRRRKAAVAAEAQPVE